MASGAPFRGSWLARMSRFSEEEDQQYDSHEEDGDETAVEHRETIKIDPFEGRHKIWGRCDTIVSSSVFDLVLLAVVFFHLGLTILETNKRGLEESIPEWVKVMNWLCLVVYCLELLCKFFIYRCKFFNDKWNVLDLTIVSLDVTSTIFESLSEHLPSMSIVRMVRLVRLVRAVRILSGARELYIMLHGMLSAMRAIAWGSCLVGLVLIIWSIIAVEFVHPINKRIIATGRYGECIRCASAFETVWESVLTLLKWNLAGGWDDVFFAIVAEEAWTAIFFVIVLVTVTVGLLNLVLTAIVDRAHDARAEDEAAILAMKTVEFENAKKKLFKVCQDMDADQSGSLEIDEIADGFDNNDDFRNILKLMDVNKDDMACVFGILDEDGSGDVSYAEFVDQIYKMKQQNQHTLLVFIRYHVVQARQKVLEGLGSVQRMLNVHAVQQERKLKDLVSRISLMENTQNDFLAAQAARHMPHVPLRNQAAESVAASSELPVNGDSASCVTGLDASGDSRRLPHQCQGSMDMDGDGCPPSDVKLANGAPTRNEHGNRTTMSESHTSSRQTTANGTSEGFSGQVRRLRTAIQKDLAAAEKAAVCCTRGLAALQSSYTERFTNLSDQGITSVEHLPLPGSAAVPVSKPDDLSVRSEQLQGICADLAGQAEMLISAHMDEALLLRNLSKKLFYSADSIDADAKKGSSSTASSPREHRPTSRQTEHKEIRKSSKEPDLNEKIQKAERRMSGKFKIDAAFQQPLPPDESPPPLPSDS